MGDYGEAKRWLKRQTKDVRVYVSKQRNTDMARLVRNGLSEYVLGKAHIGNATGAIMYLAGYRSMLGCAQVFDGNEDGFKEIRGAPCPGIFGREAVGSASP